MEKVIENQNLAIDIGHHLLDFLDDKSLMSCRFVNSALKNMVDNPKYWIKKLANCSLLKTHANGNELQPVLANLKAYI